MDQDQRLQLKILLVKHEGLKQYPYTDTTGNLSIGVGRNLQGRGITIDEAMFMLNDDIDYFHGYLLQNLPYYESLDFVRQIVLLDMCFNLGIQRFFKFKNFLNDLKLKNYKQASLDMLESIWAQQVGERAQELSKMMLTGEYV